MNEALEMAAVAIAAFVSTNVDNLALLTVLLGQRGQRRMAVLYGFVASVAAIATLGLVVARAADAVPSAVIGYLGLVPLAMGLYRLRAALRPAPAAADAPAPAALGAAGVAALTVSNGADTLGVFLPIFAETPEPLTYVIAATAVAAALLWFLLATRIAGLPWVRTRVAKLERWLVPILLIAVGLYILSNSPTDTVLDSDPASPAIAPGP